MKLDILAFAAHPDDVELACSGTLLSHIAAGAKAGIVDLTRGELGTRGNIELRRQEAEKASEIMGISVRENLEMRDGFFKVDEEHILAIIKMIRKYQPEIILCNAESDRHVDHGRAGHLLEEAAYLSGLRKIETEIDGAVQERWRAKAVYHYIQDRYIKPDIVVDISDYFEKKMACIHAFASQFYDPASVEPETPISGRIFFDHIKGRAIEYGRLIGVQYGEGFTVRRTVGTKNLMDIL